MFDQLPEFLALRKFSTPLMTTLYLLKTLPGFHRTCRKTNWDRTTRRNHFREKNPSLGRFLHIAAEISKFMSHSISHVWPTSRLFLPLKIFLRHLWPRFSFWKHSPGSIECVGKRIVIVRRVEMILERKTWAWAVFDQCLSKSSLKTHAFWLYFQGIFHQKNGENCSGGVEFIPKCSEKF